MTLLLLASAASAQTAAQGSGFLYGRTEAGHWSAYGMEAGALLDASTTHGLFSAGVSVAAAAITTGGNWRLDDLGSSVFAGLRLADDSPDTLELRVFPFSQARLVPAFDWADAWGVVLDAPSVQLSWRRSTAEFWVALSGYKLGAPQTDLGRALTIGARAELLPGLHSELAFAYQSRTGIGVSLTQRLMGGSGRVYWLTGGGVQQQLDWVTYQSDPRRYDRLAQRESYDQTLAAYVGIEGGFLVEEIPSTMAARIVDQALTGYLDLQARLRWRQLRLFGGLRVLPPDFLELNTVDTTTMDDGLTSVSGTIGADYRLPGSFTPGFWFRLIRPGARATRSGIVMPVKNWRVLNGQPFNPDGISKIEARQEFCAYLTWTWLRWLNATLLIDYVRDPNNQARIGGFPELGVATTVETTTLRLLASGSF